MQNAAKEADLATITLTEQAASRLGIESAAIEYRKVRRTRVFGGEVVVPPGHGVTVSSPVAGRLGAPPGPRLAAGARVKAREPIFHVYPLPDLLRAREDVAQAEVRAGIARARAKRAEDLLRDRAGSVRAREEAQADLSSAETALAEARARLALVERPTVEDASRVAPLVIASPLPGVLSAVHTAPGQVIAAGAPLFTVEDTKVVWIRVPVYVGELDLLDLRQPISVQGMADGPGAGSQTGRPVPAPPSASPAAASVDLFYAVDNGNVLLRPGQKVRAVLPLQGEEEALVVPWPAVLYDIHGGAWVYENTAPQVFVRRRIVVGRVVDALAVLEGGPKPGTRVVTAGAAELFGTEFATGK